MSLVVLIVVGLVYNARPTWLQNAHDGLDRAVFMAYGWPAHLTDGEVLRRLLALNTERYEDAEP